MNNNKALVSGGGDSNLLDSHRPPEDDVCPICFGPFQVPCKTGCGHWYCGSCLTQLWRHTGVENPCKCPVCSKVITKLFPISPQIIWPDVSKILKEVNQFNKLNGNGWFGIFQKLKRRLREDDGMRISKLVGRAFMAINMLLVFLIHFYYPLGLDFLPDWWHMMATGCVQICYFIWTFISMDADFYRLGRLLDR